MVLGEVHVGQHVLAQGIHHRAELGLLLTKRVGDDVPLRRGLGLGLLGEDGLQHGGDGSALLGRGIGERVAHPMHAAPLQTSIEDAAGSSAQALVVVSDHQLDAA